MGDLFGPQHRTLHSRQSMYRLESSYEGKYFCGPGGVARRLRYNSITMPVNPRMRSNRDRVKLLRNALLWGMCAFAAFQLIPPLEESMANSSSGRPDHYIVQVEWFVASSIPALWVSALHTRCWQQPDGTKVSVSLISPIALKFFDPVQHRAPVGSNQIGPCFVEDRRDPDMLRTGVIADSLKVVGVCARGLAYTKRSLKNRKHSH
jgi:hypothetical protein